VLCPNCGCELPETAEFCLSCGAKIECDATEVVMRPPALASNASSSNLSVTAESIGSGAFVNGNAGAALPTILATETPPYAAFVFRSLGFALCVSVVAFEIGNNLAHGQWRSATSSVVASVVAIIFLLSALNRWARIKKFGDSAVYRKKLLTRSIVFAVLFVITAAIVGSAIGKTGKETAEMVADLGEMSRIGDRISQARNAAARTVPAQIAMYNSIELDVGKFDTVLHRLQGELAVYEAKFPENHDEIGRSIHSIEVSLRRASILRQQISVAKEIAPLDPTAQWAAWQGKMQPLLSAEDALDKN
jgi:hypothetical protein